MENQVDKLKHELVQEIKDLAAEISKSNSFVGLLSQEIKFKALHEKFINLKFLERKHIGLNVFDQPIPMSSEQNDFPSNEDESEQAHVVHFEKDELKSKDDIDPDFDENVMQYSETKIEEIENENTDSDKTDEIPQEIKQDESVYVEDEEDESLKIVSEESSTESEEEQDNSFENEIASHSIDNVEDFLPKHSNLPKIQVDFNDRMAFLHQLFDGDLEAFNLVINTLNHIESLSDSKAYISDLVKEMSWENKDEYVERLEELIHKRFD